MQLTPMLSWDFIATGACAWTDSRQILPCDTPEGVELRVEPATRSAPLIIADQTWEASRLAWVQVMHDEGRYRMWYGITSKPDRRLCYAESDDGMNWAKPELGLVEIDGSAANNVVYHGPGGNHACVFVDPTGPPQARYRCMIFASWWQGEPGELLSDEEGLRRLNAKNQAQPDEDVLPVGIVGKMRGLNSPDGLRWTMIEEPILDEWHDTHNICRYDEALGKYRGYFRGFYGGRRAISYAETDNFEVWPPSRAIHHHLITDGPGDSLYSNGYTRYPGHDKIHLMFPAIYHQADDSVDGHLAVSLDGYNWSRHTDQPVVPRALDADPPEAYVYPEPDLLRFPREGKFRLPCRCGATYHNQAYNKAVYGDDEPHAAARWAEWTEDRLAGIHAGGEGSFTIPPQACGERLLANFRTAPDGWVQFELADRVIWPPAPVAGIAGHRFDDMEPLTGDQTHAPVQWGDNEHLSEFAGSRVAVRVRLYKATLFSLTMYGADDPGVQEDPRYPV